MNRHKKHIYKILLMVFMLCVFALWDGQSNVNAANISFREEINKGIRESVAKINDTNYSYAYIGNLNIPASGKAVLTDYVNSLERFDGLYWVDSCRGVSYSEDNSIITHVWVNVKLKYKNSDRTINKEQAAIDGKAFYDRLENEGWRVLLKERIYERALKASLTYTYNGFVVEYDDMYIPENEIKEIEKYVLSLRSYPEFYWMKTAQLEHPKVAVYADTKFLGSGGYIDFEKVNEGYEKYIIDMIELQADIQSLNYQMDDKMTDVEKVLAIHEWVVRECEYDYQNYLNGTIPMSSYAKEGVIKNHIAVCNGYTLAMNYLLEKYGVNYYKVDSDDMNHTWNVVEINGEYYHVDSTWNDLGKDENDEGRFYHKYFLKSDEEFTDLKHYGWNGNLICDDSGSFAGYIFRVYATSVNSFSYYDGYWYFVSWAGNITKAKIDASDPSVFKDYTENVVNAFMYYNDYYVATTRYVYKINMITGEEEIVFDIKEHSTIGGYIVEFTLKDRTLKIEGTEGAEYIKLYSENASISIQKEELLLGIGKTKKIKFDSTNVASEEIAWISMAPDIVSVDKYGKIMGLIKGSTYVYAVIDNMYVKCEVVVEENVVEPLVVELQADSLNVAKGDVITFTANGQGGSEEFLYSFIMYNEENGTWYRFGDFSEHDTLIWLATTTASRTFYVEIKDSEGEIVRSEGIRITVEAINELKVNIETDKNILINGQNVNIKAVATGGYGNYTYSFLMYNVTKDSWYRFGDYKETNQLIWQAQSCDKRIFYVEVKDGRGNVVRSEGVEINISEAIIFTPKLIVNDTVASLGDQLEFCANVDGNPEGITYSFLMYNAEKDCWYRFGDFSSNNILSWTVSGNRVFYVEARDDNGVIKRSEGVKITI